MHGLNYSGAKGLGHVTDAQLGELFVGMGCGISRHPPGNLRKEIAARKLLIIFVDVCHIESLLGGNGVFAFEYKFCGAGHKYMARIRIPANKQVAPQQP